MDSPAGDPQKVHQKGQSPRWIAATAVENVLAKRVHADTVLDTLIGKHSLAEQDRSLTTELTYGTLRWLKRLDWVFENLYKGNFRRIPGMVRRVAEVGLYQILFLDKIPNYAAVHEAVKAAKTAGGAYWGGVVNAVLRNVIRNPDCLKPPLLVEDPLLSISIQWSHPEWLVRKWIRQFGVERTVSLCAANNTVPAFSMRVNRMKTDAEHVLKELAKNDIAASTSSWHDDFLIVQKPMRSVRTDLFTKGWFTIQDESAGFVPKLLDPKPGDAILDMTAAPGGKSTAIAELTGDQATVVSSDRHWPRVRQIVENKNRLGLRNVYPVVANASLPITIPMDKVLLDAPCSGIGILRKHPEIRWKRSPEEITGLVSLQKRLLESAARALKPGGILVYSTCTVLPEENGEGIQKFIKSHPEFAIEDARSFVNSRVVTEKGWIETWPDIHGMDGSFAVRMKKAR